MTCFSNTSVVVWRWISATEMGPFNKEAITLQRPTDSSFLMAAVANKECQQCSCVSQQCAAPGISITPEWATQGYLEYRK